MLFLSYFFNFKKNKKRFRVLNFNSKNFLKISKKNKKKLKNKKEELLLCFSILCYLLRCQSIKSKKIKLIEIEIKIQ